MPANPQLYILSSKHNDSLLHFFLISRFIPPFLRSVYLTLQTHAPTPFIHEHVAGASVIFVHPASTPSPSGSCALILFWASDPSPLQSTSLQF